ncbi:tape measure protein [Streptococcus thoraltensis]|uniref:tape measure protein n=1 Tax=Streptococcus thoraltensis TaxID=55085 RepID=UPI001F586191|nr:tape measure protein [Streptococcus thoraltensis]
MTSKTYTVEAILKATDSSFTKTMRGAMAAVNALRGGSKKTTGMFKTMFGANLASSALIAGLGVAKRGIGSMITELNSSNLAWKSFEGNMKILGKSDKAIAKAKASMQDYATKTIYSASDMASTYAQLASVGVKNTGKLVKGFGGLAAAAENPKQAMKTLSQQATQMAAKPMVQWQDFKLMLEQTPAGIAAVAKEMGMSTQEMVKAVQDGKISTEDFFKAIQKVGNNKSFSKMATEFKSVGQAIDGMKEGISNKLEPAFEKFNQFGIKVFEDLASRMDKINFDRLAKKIGSALDSIDISGIFDAVENTIRGAIDAVNEFWSAFKNTGAVTAVTNAFAHIKDAFEHVKESLSGNGDIFKDLGKAVGDIVTWLSQAVTGISNFVSNMDPGTIEATAKAVGGLYLAFKGLSLLANLNPFTLIVGAIAGLVLAFAQAYNSSEKFRNGVDKALQILKEWGPAIAAVVGGFAIFKMLNGWNPFKAFASKGKSAFDGLKKGFEGGADGAKRSKGIIEQVFSGLGSVIESAGTGISTAAKGIGTGIKTALSGVPAILTALGTAVSTAATGIGTGLATAFQGLGAAIAIVPPTTWLALGAAILMVGAAFALAGTQADGISQIFQTVGNVIVQILQQVTISLATLIPIVANAMAMLIPIIASAISTVVTAVASGIAQIIGAIAGGLATIIGAVSTGIATIVNAFSGLVDSISGFVSAISGVLDSIANVITAFGDSVSGILDSIGGVFESFGESIKTVFEGAGKVIESFGTSVKSILDGVSGVIESIGKAALNAGKGVKLMAQGIKMLVDLPLGDLSATLSKTASGLGKIADKSSGLASAGTAMSSVSSGIRTLGTASTTAVSGMSQLGTRIQTLKSTMTALPAVMTNAASSFSTFTSRAVAGMAGLVAINTPIATFKLQLTSLSLAITQASMGFTKLSTGVMVIVPAFTMLTSTMTMLTMNLTMLSTTLTTVSVSFMMLVGTITLMTGAIMTVASSFGNVGAQATSAGNHIRQFATTSQVVISNFSAMAGSVRSSMSSIASAISSGMSRAKSEVQTSMRAMLATMQRVGNQMVSTMRSSGSKAGQSFASGLRSQSGTVNSAVSSLVNAAISRARAGYGPMQSAGNWIGQGLANGMRAALGAVTAAANALVAQAERAARAKAEINSPSHLFRDEVGYWIGAGVAVGIDKSAGLAVDSIQGLYDDIQSISYKANDLLDTNFSYDLQHNSSGTMRIENPSQNQIILELLNQLNRSLDRDIVLNVNDKELARTTGDAFNSFHRQKETALKRMGGDI